MEDDISDGVRGVDDRDVVYRFGSGKSHETYDSCVWFKARKVKLPAVRVTNQQNRRYVAARKVLSPMSLLGPLLAIGL